MPIFKSKPVTIEAEQFFHDKPLPFAMKGPYVAFDDGTFYVITNNCNKAVLHDGDWVVLEPTGPHTPSFAAYPIRPDIFENRWARVGAEPSPYPEEAANALGHPYTRGPVTFDRAASRRPPHLADKEQKP